MNTIKKITLLSAISFVLAGCDLDTKPYKSIDVDQLTAGNVETLTLGTYAYMKSNNGIMRSAHYFGEYGSDNLSLSGSTSDVLMNIYNYLRTTQNSRIGDIWSYSYKTIININATLEVATEGQSKEFDMIIGENYYLRAYHYFTLVTTFGQPYTNGNPETNLGVPIKLTTSLDDFPARASVKEVYDQIEKDLLKAIEMMTISGGSTMEPKNSCYASKEVAEALLSRVYLYMERWDKVLEYTNNVINSGRYTLLEGDVYKGYPTYVPEENSETIFAVRYTKDVDYQPSYRGYMIGSMYARIDNDGWGEMYPSDSYLRLLDLHPNDLRHGFIRKQSLNNGNYWFIYTKNNAYVKVPITKAGDVYTMIDPSGYQSATVAKESYHGGTVYTVTTTDGIKFHGRVEEEMDIRNDYPKYFIYKCSLQEGQAQLWSPIVSRLAEMYLNRAEAKFHLNDSKGALDDVNVIRKRAGIPEWTLTNLPEGATVLEITLEERRLELAFEAQRRFDIYRNKMNLDRNYPGGHISSGGPTQVKFDDKIVVEFIPQSEMLSYPKQGVLVQNP